MSLTISSEPIAYTQKTTNVQKYSQVPVVQQKESADSTVVINNSPKANLEKLKKEGCYRGEEKFFFGLYTRKAEFTYYADGKECIAEIMAKFGLKEGAIARCNGISDEDYIPEKGKEIYFYEEDANYNAE